MRLYVEMAPAGDVVAGTVMSGKKNRVTTNGGGFVESSWYIYCYYIHENIRLSCANKINAYISNRSAESLGGGIRVQYYIK